MQTVDLYLDDERFVAPWRARFPARLGRPSVPVDTLLQLLYLKHRYQLGYESLCREVSDPIGWRRFCRIGLDRPPPHLTTLVKLGAPGRPGGDRGTERPPHRRRPAGHAVSKLGGLVRRSKGRGVGPAGLGPGNGAERPGVA